MLTGGLLWLILVCSAASAVSAVAGAAWLGRHVSRAHATSAHVDDASATWFDIDRGRLAGASPAAREYLALLDGAGWSGPVLLDHLTRSFPGLREAMLRAMRSGHERVASFDRARTLSVDSRGDRLRLTVEAAETDLVTMDRSSHACLRDELDTLRAMGEHLSYPTWRQTSDGTIVWANRAYLDLSARITGGDGLSWPPPVLFSDLVATGGEATRRRIDTAHPVDHVATDWFDCNAQPIGDDLFATAVPADALIRAERTLEDYTQSFARTFAHLTVGIAVFGRDRELLMFNPALAELTTLPMDLLLGQPRLSSFLDALRARSLTPEPGQRLSWRQHVTEIEEAAQNGSYSELWHLPGNRTFRITGRPQIDGAFALLIEDISAEVSLTRRFRSELETGRAVLDALPDAIAVFDRAANLVQTNVAYDTLWGVTDSDGVTHLDADDAVRAWDGRSVANRVWSDVRLNLTLDVPDGEWSTDIQLLDGRALNLTITALPGGMRLTRFSAAPRAPRSRLTPVAGADRIDSLLKA